MRRLWLRAQDMACLIDGVELLGQDEAYRQVRSYWMDFSDVPDQTLRDAIEEAANRAYSSDRARRAFMPNEKPWNRREREIAQAEREMSFSLKLADAAKEQHDPS